LPTDQVRILRVVLASPGDVDAERKLVPGIIDDVNRNIARDRGLRLELYSWETDSYPGFHPKGPQGQIDPQLKIDTCDALIGIFWHRFGTPTTDAKSGTEHEIRLAYAAWEKTKQTPLVMLYFSKKAYTPNSKEETDQWGQVLDFKKEFRTKGVLWDYKNKSDFKDLLRNHLSLHLNSKFPLDKNLSAPEGGVPQAGVTETGVPQVSPPLRDLGTTLGTTPAPLTPLFQLPPPPADFTGRETELLDLRAAIESGGVHISGLHGQGGVGKTTLALKLAADLAPKFPDAQIYLDLKGVSEKPLTAVEALSHVVRTFHPEAKLPEKIDDLCPLYRSVLHNKRVLLLMDNAKDAAQVQHLAPPPGCALLVTSRNHFHLDGIKAANLDMLPPADATKLLLQIAPRINGEVDAIAKLCGYLPQALRLAGTAIAERRDLKPEKYREKLADEKYRLELLGGGEKGIDASITLSYNLLDPETQLRWRKLGTFPDTFDASAAAAVWESELDPAQLDRTQDALSDLLKFSLLEWNESTDRYRLHDLMRAFARAKCSQAESNAAALQHARHYRDVTESANNLYEKGGETLMRGLALFDLEWGNIQAGHSWASAHSSKDPEATRLCSDYPDWGSSVLGLRQHPRDRIRWFDAALAAARKLQDRAAEGRHLGNLGQAYQSVGEYRRAIEFFEQVLVIASEIEDRQGEGNASGGLGNAYFSLGEYDTAIEHYEKWLAVAREIGDRRGEGNAQSGLAVAFHSLGEYPRAIKLYEQHLVIAREIGDRRGEGNAEDNLGVAYKNLGEYRRAIEFHEQHLVIAREIGDRHGEGTALWNMSLALDALGQHDEAIQHAEASLKIHEEIEDPFTETVRKALKEWRGS
jgi:tetratricopeptide (TPR) repeat protein